jgi:PucR C-terminal helix-turn-helix domain
MPTRGHAYADRRRAEIWFRVVKELDHFPEEQRRKARETLSLAIAVYCSRADAAPAAEWDPRDVAALRTLGHGWALQRWQLDPLLDLLGKVGEQAAVTLAQSAHLDLERTAARLRVLAETGTRLLCEVLNGFQEAPPARGADRHQTAVWLLRGEPVPPGADPVASAYAVMAYRTTSPNGRLAVTDAGQRLGDGVLYALCQTGGYLLVPAADETSAMTQCTKLHQWLLAPSWAGVCWAPTARLPRARVEAVEVVASALASRRVPGCYRLADVLVEYAVLTQPSVASIMVSMIEPVTRSAVLLATLRALLTADGNRTKAAADLTIHRSTLDYRLQRIERLTGHDPTSARELQVLSTALTAHEAATTVSPALPLDPVG